MTTMQRMDRSLALACDRALSGLDPAEEMELVSKMAPGTRLDPNLELAAASIALAELCIDEPMPRSLADKIFANAQRGATAPPLGSQARTMPLSGGAPEARTIALIPSSPPSVPRPAASSERAERVAEVVPIQKARRGSMLPWLAAAACLALAIGTLVYVRFAKPGTPGGAPVASAPAKSLTPSEAKAKLLGEAKDVVRTSWAATGDPAGKGETGEVVWSNERQEGYMTFRNVQANDPKSMQYQLWIFDETRDEAYPVDGGVFDVDTTKGEVTVPISAKVAVGKPKLFAVTAEKPGGVVVSKRERIVVTAPVTS